MCFTVIGTEEHAINCKQRSNNNDTIIQMKILFCICIGSFLVKYARAQIPFLETVDSIGATITPVDSVVLYKKCITAKKDTLRFFKDKEEKQLTQIVCGLYNPSRNPLSDKHGWAYYFVHGELIMAAHYSYIDKRRPYGSVKYYFCNRECTYRSPVFYNITSPVIILREADKLLKLAAGEKCIM